MKFKIYISFLLILFSYQKIKEEKEVEIKIVYVNDIHGKIDQFPYLSTFINELRKKHKHVILVSAGDIFSGNPIVDKYKQPGYPIINLMNKIGFNISTLGNHEFDYGIELLKKNINSFDEKIHNIVCANIIKFPSKGFERIKPYASYQTDGVSIIFLGLTNTSNNGKPDTNPINLIGFEFENELFTINRYASTLKKYDLSIIVSHLGFEKDSIIATNFDFIDVIIGGHDHKILINKKIKNTLICQAGNYLQYVGVLTIKLKNKKIIHLKDTIFALKNFPPDSSIQKIVDLYYNNQDFNKVIWFFNDSIKDKEEIGFFMANSYKTILKTDFAIQNKGGVRLYTINKGNFTLKNLYELDPFSNELYICSLSTSQIKNFLIKVYEDKKNLELLPAGFLSYYYLNNENNIEKIEIFDYNKNLLPDSNVYTIAIGDYLLYTYYKEYTNSCYKSNLTTTDALIKTFNSFSFNEIKHFFKKNSFVIK